MRVDSRRGVLAARASVPYVYERGVVSRCQSLADRLAIDPWGIPNKQTALPSPEAQKGMGECDGFRGFARNMAAASSDLRVIIVELGPPWERCRYL